MKSLPALFAAALLVGCTADQTRYPSLLPRAAERASFAEPAAVAPAPVVPDPQLDTRLSALAGRLETATRGFDADLARAHAAAAATGARSVGSEAWLTAQQALAALDDWRAQATGVASELETAAGERLGAAGVAYPALDALQARAAAEADRQGAAIAKLSAAVPAQ